MSPPPHPHRIIVTYAAPEAFAPMTRAILAKLGYAIYTEEEFEHMGSVRCERPDVRIVDERNLACLPEDDGPSVPVVVLCGRHGVTGADPRITGAVRRPAGLHELYRVVQQVSEDRPRGTPRVATHLAARISKGGREWKAAMLSLSENGCLLRSPEPLMLGTTVDLQFELPRSGVIELAAETAYQLVPDLGLVFHATSPAERDAIGSFITEALVAL